MCTATVHQFSRVHTSIERPLCKMLTGSEHLCTWSSFYPLQFLPMCSPDCICAFFCCLLHHTLLEPQAHTLAMDTPPHTPLTPHLFLHLIHLTIYCTQAGLAGSLGLTIGVLVEVLLLITRDTFFPPLPHCTASIHQAGLAGSLGLTIGLLVEVLLLIIRDRHFFPPPHTSLHAGWLSWILRPDHRTTG